MSGILTLINATHSGILTSPRSSKPYDSPSPPEERSPTMPRQLPEVPVLHVRLPLRTGSGFRSVPFPLYLNIHGFGGKLEPRYIFGAGSLDQWAITHSLKDGCFWANLLVVWGTPLPFPLSLRLGALAGGLGCFPFDYQTYLRQSHSRGTVKWHWWFG